MALKRGWQGRTYEGFEVGDIYRHPIGRTITQADNIWFTLLRVNNNPLHFDDVHAARTGFNQHGRVVLEFKRSIPVYRRGHVPQPSHPLPAK